MHISKWLDDGSPKGEWFYIVRHERLSRVDERTPILLAELVLHALESYGEFETRQHQCFFGEYFSFDYKGHEFMIAHAIGNINGEDVPVMATCIDAKISSS